MQLYNPITGSPLNQETSLHHVDDDEVVRLSMSPSPTPRGVTRTDTIFPPRQASVPINLPPPRNEAGRRPEITRITGQQRSAVNSVLAQMFPKSSGHWDMNPEAGPPTPFLEKLAVVPSSQADAELQTP